MRFIVKPNQLAFHNNRRWREGQIVEIEHIKDAKDPKKWPRWGVPADSDEAKKVRDSIANRLLANRGKTFSPEAETRAKELLAQNDA